MAKGIDTGYRNRLIVLDPAHFSLRNGMEAGTLEALTAAMGLGDGLDHIPGTWTSSAVFAVVNTQRRAHARKIAVECLAAKKAFEAPEVQSDADLKRTGTAEPNEAKDNLRRL